MKEYYNNFFIKNEIKIKKIKFHLKNNKKDLSSRRGLKKNINLRKKMIKYLKKKKII
ncbi:30S ribosomal protein S15 [Candidatus Vidania fulgoroideorum]